MLKELNSLTLIYEFRGFSIEEVALKWPLLVIYKKNIAQHWLNIFIFHAPQLISLELFKLDFGYGQSKHHWTSTLLPRDAPTFAILKLVFLSSTARLYTSISGRVIGDHSSSTKTYYIYFFCRNHNWLLVHLFCSISAKLINYSPRMLLIYPTIFTHHLFGTGTS